MTIFVDASALIAMIAGEDDARILADRLDMEKQRFASAMSIWETMAGLCRSYGLSVPAARMQVRRFLDTGNFQIAPIGERELEIAADAYARFGKGRHPASLNMGDCFAYACATANKATLLYKGEDFARTDLAYRTP